MCLRTVQTTPTIPCAYITVAVDGRIFVMRVSGHVECWRVVTSRRELLWQCWASCSSGHFLVGERMIPEPDPVHITSSVLATFAVQ